MSPDITVHIPMLPEIKSLLSNYLPLTYSTATFVLSAALLLYIILKSVLFRLSAPTRELPGPKSVNWLTGSHARDVWEPDSLENQLEWTRQYGPVFRYYGWFNVNAISYHRHAKSDHYMIARWPGSLPLICKH
jgi:hypothetical protein